jgi:hypothetical protein
VLAEIKKKNLGRIIVGDARDGVLAEILKRQCPITFTTQSHWRAGIGNYHFTLEIIVYLLAATEELTFENECRAHVLADEGAFTWL